MNSEKTQPTYMTHAEYLIKETKERNCSTADLYKEAIVDTISRARVAQCTFEIKTGKKPDLVFLPEDKKNWHQSLTSLMGMNIVYWSENYVQCGIIDA